MVVISYNPSTAPNYKAKTYWPHQDDKEEYTMESVPIVLVYNGYSNYAATGNLTKFTLFLEDRQLQ